MFTLYWQPGKWRPPIENHGSKNGRVKLLYSMLSILCLYLQKVILVTIYTVPIPTNSNFSHIRAPTLGRGAVGGGARWRSKQQYFLRSFQTSNVATMVIS